jgi:CXCXC repeat
LDEQWFDQLSKSMAGTVSRRQAVKVLGATALGGLFAGVGARGAQARLCRDAGQNCRSNAECCTRFCDTTFHCACASGTVLCQGDCVPVCTPPKVLNPTTCACECDPAIVCPPPKILNPQTCSCQCPPGTITCGQTQCCPPGTVCQSGTCVTGVQCGNQFCPVTQICCTTFFGTQCCAPGQACSFFSGCF